MKYKYVGYLNPEIAKYWNIEEHKNKPILVYEDRINHVIDEHFSDFENNIDRIMCVYDNLEKIIKTPDYVFYNEKTNGLEYYKKLENDVCVAVRVNSGAVLKIKSWYPANPNKINNRKSKDQQKNISE